MTIVVHVFAELIAKKLSGLSEVPHGEQQKMIHRAVVAAAKYHDDQITELERQTRPLLEIAERTEWHYPDGKSGNCCPLCYQDEKWGRHSDDCPYQLAIDVGMLRKKE